VHGQAPGAAIERVRASESGTGITPVRDVDYTYDALNRLTVEEVRVPEEPGEAWRLEGRGQYTYDDVGNRLVKESCSGEPVVCATTTYEYNANIQLLTETGSDETVAYYYDTNGSLAEKDVDDGTDVLTTTYAYDARNRMIAAETPDDALGFAYDTDSIRVMNGELQGPLITLKKVPK